MVCRWRPASSVHSGGILCSNLITGVRPTLVRTALSGGRPTRSSGRSSTALAAASRARPRTPGSGLRPIPNGGTPGERRSGVNGQKHAHGMSPASAADIAPQQFTSRSKASGLTCAIASARLPTLRSARLPNTEADIFSAAIGFVPCQSSWVIASMPGSIASAVNPRDRPMSIPPDSVRR